jgi:hypothetical protein
MNCKCNLFAYRLKEQQDKKPNTVPLVQHQNPEISQI